MSRRFKTRSIKADKNYNIDELANVTGVTKPTVRNWIKAGMVKMDGKRPTIIMGFHALEYLNKRKASSKRPLALGKFFCCRCKASRTAFGGMADYIPSSQSSGRLEALCSVCECQLNLHISDKKLGDLAKVLDIEIRDSNQRREKRGNIIRPDDQGKPIDPWNKKVG